MQFGITACMYPFGSGSQRVIQPVDALLMVITVRDVCLILLLSSSRIC